MNPGATKRGLLALACFSALAFALLAPSLVGGRLFFPFHTESMLPWRSEVPAERLIEHAQRANPELSDKLWLIEPGAALAAESWRRGEVPAWNPTIVGGTPQLGLALDGALYPPNLLLMAIRPLERAYAWDVALHVLLAGLGTFWLARRLGLSTGPSILAGIFFAAGGPLAVQYHLHMRFFAAVWIPWLLAAVHAFTERPTLLRLAAVPPPIALVVLSGFPQTGLYGILGAALFGGWRLLARAPARGWRGTLGPLAALGGAFVVGAALSAGQLLPVDDASRRALPRAHDVAQQIRESGTRWMLAGYLVPGAFQDARAAWSQDLLKNPLWNGLYAATERRSDGATVPSGTAARPSMTEGCCYLGAIGFLLALAALLRKPGRGSAVAFALLACLALCWAYALGEPTIVKLIGRLPRTDVGEVRRVVSTIGLLGALLAALGAQRLLDPAALGARRSALLLATLAVALLFGLELAVERAGPEGFAAWLRERQLERYGAALIAEYDARITPSRPVTKQIHEFVAGRLGSATAWAAAAWATLLLLHALVQRGRVRTATLLLAVVAAADLGALHFRVNPFVPAAGFLAPDPLLAPLAATESGGRVRRFAPDFAMGDDPIEKLVVPPDLGGCLGIEDAEGYLVRLPTRYARFLRALEPEQEAGQTVVTVAALPIRSAAALRSPLLDLAAVKHVLTRYDLLGAVHDDAAKRGGDLAKRGGATADEPDDGGFRLVGRRGESRVYENLQALPFAVVVSDAWLLPAAPPDDAIGVAADAGLPPDPRLDRPENVELARRHAAALRELAAHPELLRQRLFLESAPPAGAAADPARVAVSSVDLALDASPAGGAAGSPGPAKLVRLATVGAVAKVVSIARSPHRLEIGLDGKGGGFLLLSEGFDPGWRATIDGAPAPVLPADVAFRGVALPPGARRVVLDYRPASVTRGLSISGAALALLAMALVAGLISGARARRAAAAARPAREPPPGAPPPAAAHAG